MRQRVIIASTGALFVTVLAVGVVLTVGHRREPIAAPVSPPNCILVVIDTLRADRLGCYGYDRPTTPHLDRLTNEAVLFRRAYAPSPWTLPSFGSLLTGTNPSTHLLGLRSDVADQRSISYAGLHPDVATLAEMFARRGRRTCALVNNEFLNPLFGIDRGFDEYDFRPSNNLDMEPADAMVDQALAWIGQHSGAPYFLLLHLFDPHMSYGPPPAHAAPFISGYTGRLTAPFNGFPGRRRRVDPAATSEDWRFISGLYDGEVHFVDEQIGRFVEALRLRGELERALLLVTADHGEEINDHGGIDHGHTLHEELLRVPLLMRFPMGRFRGRVVATPVSLIDIVPTLTAVFDLPGAHSAEGIDLLPLMAGASERVERALLAEFMLFGPRRRGLLEGDFKVIFEEPGVPQALFDVVRDPGETMNLLPQHRARALAMGQRLAKLTARSGNRRVLAKPVLLSDEVAERLRALGYLDTSTDSTPP